MNLTFLPVQVTYSKNYEEREVQEGKDIVHLDWYMLIFGRKQQISVKQLSCN